MRRQTKVYCHTKQNAKMPPPTKFANNFAPFPMCGVKKGPHISEKRWGAAFKVSLYLCLPLTVCKEGNIKRFSKNWIIQTVVGEKLDLKNKTSENKRAIFNDFKSEPVHVGMYKSNNDERCFFDFLNSFEATKNRAQLLLWSHILLLLKDSNVENIK